VVDGLPPQDLDAEMALLGSMMMDRAAVDTAAPIVGSREAFYLPVHGQLYDVLVSLWQQGTAIDLLTVSNELRRRDLFDTVGGQPYMIQLAESFADWVNVGHYAAIVAGHHRRRQLMSLGTDLRSKAADIVGEDPDELCARYANLIEAVGISSASGQEIQSMHELTATLPAKLKALPPHIPTGIASFDAKIGGIERGALTIIAAGTSAGKTALGVQFAITAGMAGIPSLVVSLEMSADSIARRVVAYLTGTSSRRLLEGSPDEQATACNEAAKQLADCKLGIDDKPRYVRDIVATARQYIRRHGAGLIVIDYLQVCEPDGKHDTRPLAVASMTAAFKRLAVDTGAAVIVISQLTRDATREDTTPKLAHLRDSGAIEQDADVVIFIRPDRRVEGNDIPVVLIVAKNRNGPTANIPVEFHRPSTRFSEVAVQDKTSF